MFDFKNLMNVCRTCLNYFDHHSSVPVDSVEESSAKSYRDFLSEWHTGYTTFNNPTYEEHLPQQVCQDCAQRIDGILQFQTETVFNLRLLSAIGEAKLTGKCTLLRKLLRSEKYRKTLCKLGQIEQDNILSVDDLLNVFDQSSVCHATIKKEVTEPPKEGGLDEKNDIPIVYGQLQEQTPPEGESDLELDMKFEVDDQEEWAAAEGDEPSTVKQPKKHASGIRKKPCLIEGCEPIVVGQAVQHVKEKHRTYCKICGLVFGSYTRATSHVAIHRPAEHRFSCELCPKLFWREKNLKDHLWLVHARVSKDHVCALCEEGFSTRDELKKHREIHFNSPCHLCDKKEPFNSYSKLYEHLRKFHAKQSHQCDLCSKSFLGRREYELHKERHRDGSLGNCVEFSIRLWADDYGCKSCEKTFFSQNFLEEHTKTVHKNGLLMAGTVEAHDEKDYKFKCPECDACFRVRNTLNGHIRRTHRFEKVVCDVCEISCKSRHEAKVHMRSAHINESRYKCDFCEKRFSTSGSLRIHRRTHTNERPYKCRYEGCDKEYKAGGALVKHVRAVHTNERPFRCQYEACDKAYICSQHLKTHLLWHTQEKPFKCNYCELYFNSTNNRRKHCKRHHPGRPVGRELDNTNTEDDDAVAKFTVKSKINI